MDSVIIHIRVAREVMETSRKRKFDGDRDRGSHGGHWDRNGGHGPRNSEGQNHGTARDSVTKEVVTLVEEMEITAEAEVHEGEIVKKPTTPH